MRISIDNRLYMDCPEGFHELTEEERQARNAHLNSFARYCMNAGMIDPNLYQEKTDEIKEIDSKTHERIWPIWSIPSGGYFILPDFTL